MMGRLEMGLSPTSKRDEGTLMVLNMRRLVQPVFQASCKCPKGKNLHPLCVFHSVLFMVPLCKGGIRCEICIGLGPDSIDLRQLIAERLSSCVGILTTDMLDAYADAMRDYKFRLDDQRRTIELPDGKRMRQCPVRFRGMTLDSGCRFCLCWRRSWP